MPSPSLRDYSQDNRKYGLARLPSEKYRARDEEYAPEEEEVKTEEPDELDFANPDVSNREILRNKEPDPDE